MKVRVPSQGADFRYGGAERRNRFETSLKSTNDARLACTPSKRLDLLVPLCSFPFRLIPRLGAGSWHNSGTMVMRRKLEAHVQGFIDYCPGQVEGRNPTVVWRDSKAYGMHCLVRCLYHRLFISHMSAGSGTPSKSRRRCPRSISRSRACMSSVSGKGMRSNFGLTSWSRSDATR